MVGRLRCRIQSREQYIATFARRVLRFRVLGVVAAAVSVVALAYLSLFTVTGQWLDTLIMYSFQAHMPFQDAARTVLHTLASIPALLLFALILIVTVLLRKRFALLVRIVALLVVLSNGAACQMLKYLLVRPDMEVGHSLANSFPSGHVTLATSVGLALIAAVPQRWKSVAGGVAWVAIAFVGVTVLSLGWHRLSDVLAGILVATRRWRCWLCRRSGDRSTTTSRGVLLLSWRGWPWCFLPLAWR